MIEKDIVTAIMRYLKTVPMCFAWKEHGGMYGTAGIPDIICCYHGRFVAFEVKTPSGRLTKLQEITITKIKAAKGEACKVTSVEEVKSILDSLEVKAYDDSLDIFRQKDSRD
ncbi:VRR-NUC domain-containing protein [Peptostreptococcaceae bacterium OttesenSCG-928-C18]|nr:VRR-NUC domain-containing protein [Peptostreptococcaceae bacterium OttesenSCG-928-C18]